MRILITNDDGVHAEGILALKQALEAIGEVTVVAPERPRSAAGHAITLHKPLRLNSVTLRDGSAAYAANGTPADCVILGSDVLLRGEIDLVVSGVNYGPNLGWDVHYSGTVAAAKEAAMTGHPAIAVSVASYGRDIDYSPAARFTARFAEWMHSHPMPPRTLVNINYPHTPEDRIAGIEVTRQGPRQYVDRYERRSDPAGRDYYWLGGALSDLTAPAGTDVHAIAENKISITPLQLDLTAHELVGDLAKHWQKRHEL